MDEDAALEVVSEKVWCDAKGQWKNVEVCQNCPERMKCLKPSQGGTRQSEAETLDTEVERLKIAISDNYYELGVILREVREGMYYAELGYTCMDDYAERRHGFRYRKAAYLIAIVENCEAAEIKKEDVRGIEWSKMKELPELTEDNRKEWLEKASEMSVEDLKVEVKKSKGEKSIEKKIFMSFSFDASQKEVVDRALEMAAKMTGSDVKSYHFQILAEEFISTYGPMDQASISRFENLYGPAEPSEEG